MNRSLIRAIGVTLLSLVASHARADIPVPDPPAVWSKGQAPSGNTVVAAGAAISAVVVAAGLIVARWPVRSNAGRVVVASLAGLALLAVWGIAAGGYLLANRDQALWKQWEADESSRRANWRGPDNFPPFGPPPPSSAAPESSEPAPPTALTETVQ